MKTYKKILSYSLNDLINKSEEHDKKLNQVSKDIDLFKKEMKDKAKNFDLIRNK